MSDTQHQRPGGGPTEPGRPTPPSIPEPGTAPEPRFDAPSPPAPAVVDAPGRNTEF